VREKMTTSVTTRKYSITVNASFLEGGLKMAHENSKIKFSARNTRLSRSKTTMYALKNVLCLGTLQFVGVRRGKHEIPVMKSPPMKRAMNIFPGPSAS
jgi:hypothetical protein